LVGCGACEKCDIEGVLLGMEMAENVYICDCQRTVDIFVRQGWLDRQPEILE